MEKITNTTEEAVGLIVENGTFGNKMDFTPPAGKVIGCVIYKDDLDKSNTGFVRAWIKDSYGNYLSMPQHIDNYRSRDAEYAKGGKPLNIMANGQPFSWGITSTETFTDQHKAELIFIYENSQQNCG